MKTIFPLLTVRKKQIYTFRDQFWKLISSCKKEMYVISPFIDSHIFEQIFKAVMSESEGKTLVMISRPPDNNSRKSDFLAILKVLEVNRFRYRLGSLNQVFWYQDPNLHAKILVVDKSSILFGSQNITYNGLGDDLNRSRCNNELGALLTKINKKEWDQIGKFLDGIITDSIRVFPSSGS